MKSKNNSICITMIMVVEISHGMVLIIRLEDPMIRMMALSNWEPFSPATCSLVMKPK
jgi:hypothetical protein